MAATIKMVAERAGVSVATVSKYINGGNVYEENRERIQKAIEELDYKINEVARSLKTNKTYTIGVLAATIQSSFITSIISKIQYTLLQHGYSTIIADYQENKKLEKKQLDVLLMRHVDGIILFPEENEEEIVRFIKEQNVPIVMVDNMVEGIPCDAILTDNMGGVYTAVEELIKRSHRRIGMITGPEQMYTSRERMKGYCRACEDYFVEVVPELIRYGNYDIESGYRCFTELMELANPPTAVVAGNYYMAIGALQAINEKGIRIPEQLSFIAYDHMEFAGIMTPKISTVSQPLGNIGQVAAERIVQRIKGNMENYPQVDRLKTSLNLTGSVNSL